MSFVCSFSRLASVSHALSAVELEHGRWLRWIQQHVRVRPLELRQLCHTDGHLRYAGRALGKQSVRSEPGWLGVLLHILSETDVDGIVVFGDIPIDVVQAAIADLVVCVHKITQGNTLHRPTGS